MLATKLEMAHDNTDAVDEIEISPGQIYVIESIPPDSVFTAGAPMPFAETPAHVTLERQIADDHPAGRRLVFTLRARRTGYGLLRIGYREVYSDRVLVEKRVRVSVS
ncbi:hypothetical protein ASA1KI_39350 [Opitutales bacterium ASA1]|uniref:hypothetical protein n=1 Tax=Congregicoccus parvus TaxID=3081749 RepID=UPI002B2BAEC5|nr:hypothetical protein ASA1KI_39350 [Opitutales bacterium ASA1]